MKYQWLLLIFFVSSLSAEIRKFDEEDLRNLRAMNPLEMHTAPPLYALSQVFQHAKERGYRYFAFLSYECTFGSYKTTASFSPPTTGGVLYEYQDEYLHAAYYAYFDDPDDLDVFDIQGYVFDFDAIWYNMKEE